jgi:hypothetical protein
MGNIHENKLQLGPNARLGEILKFWSMQTSALGVLSQGIKHGRVVTLSGVKFKNK